MRFFKKGKILAPAILIFLVLGFSKEASAGGIILNDLNGKTVNLSDYKGKPMILFFWTTWCPHSDCVAIVKRVSLRLCRN